ncbi:MAG: hypothetical protein IH597_15370 [Bacteroidales bacterium]|nr:hypothetical protein [Bacteroidales bacterium]
MPILIRCKPALLLLILFFPGFASSQNLFDSVHTAQYANYLFLSGNYKLAADEYERLLFQYKADETQALRLIQSYRHSGQEDFAMQRMDLIWDTPLQISGNVANEYLILQILAGNYNFVIQNSRENTLLAPQEKLFFEASSLMLEQDYPQAFSMIWSADQEPEPVLKSYSSIAAEAMSMKLKSPALSGILSGIIPGSGKIYTGEWQDGLTTFVFVGSTAWQSYRGFSKYGISSPYGWIMGAISAGFYAGNIYGSVKSANKYNTEKRNNINIRVQAVFYNHIR